MLIFHYAEKAWIARGRRYWPVQSIDGKLCATMLVSDASVAFGPEMMRMAHHLNGPNFGHAILTTPELLARLPGAMPA